jgi:ubiquinone/menaquinone biosynthesis C-methylase UbiE
MGFFTLELARRVGASGRVVVADIQPKMLDRLKRRAGKAGVLDRVIARLASPESLNVSDLKDQVDFALAFAVVHEMPDMICFFKETAQVLTSGASLLLAEPAGHVSATQFDNELAAAAQAGLTIIDRPAVPRSRAALLKKAS